mmetsp:Transcript_1328/g.2603  ORF Transcript_1328/g.2603 Transcript_1328/m.2603 type:complete len:446 (+) Transcript_1328:40-1377(+)
MERYFESVAAAVDQQDVESLAQLIQVEGSWDLANLAQKKIGDGSEGQQKALAVWCTSQARRVGLSAGMGKVFTAHAMVVALLALVYETAQGEDNRRNEWLQQAFLKQLEALDAFMVIYKDEGGYVVPTLRVLLSETRKLAVVTDRQLGHTKNESLIACKERFESCFRSFTMEKSSSEDAMERRKLALFIVNSSFKVFFGLKSLSLCRNLVNAVGLRTFPPLDTFPMSAQVTYYYFLGRLRIFEDQIPQALNALQTAFENCHPKSTGNMRRILQFLVPLNTFLGRRPSPGLLERYQLQDLGELVSCIHKGHVNALEMLIDRRRDVLIAQGLYLISDRLKLVAYRNLFRNVVAVWQFDNPDRKNRVPLDVFETPYRLFGEQDPLAFIVDGEQPEQSKEDVLEQVKCVLANLVDKGYLKAYLSHEKGILVPAGTDPFPKLANLISAGR